MFEGGQANLYAYAGDEPVNRVDRDGKNPIAIGIACALIAYAGYKLVTSLMSASDAMDAARQCQDDAYDDLDDPRGPDPDSESMCTEE